jgi:hypothetical protein
MSQEPITTYCPACGKAFRVPTELNGKKILCKACQTHFVVQPDRPGVPAAPPPAPARTSSMSTPSARAIAPAPTKAAAGPAGNPPVTAATTAPIPVPPPASNDLAPIPFDDSDIAPSVGTPAASVAKPTEIEKVKIESKGPYYVIKLVTGGKMIHVNIENALNENAADGWKLEQIVTVSGEAYAILSRFTERDAARFS